MSTHAKEIWHGAEVDVHNSVKEMLSQRCLVIILKALGHDTKYNGQVKKKRASKVLLRKVAVCVPYVDLTPVVLPQLEQPVNADAVPAQVDGPAVPHARRSRFKQFNVGFGLH